MARGGYRPNSGRKKGKRNPDAVRRVKMKEEQEWRAIADRQAFIAEVERNLQPLFYSLLREAQKGNVAAIKEMFDRAWGKSAQPISGDRENPIVFVPFELMQKYGIKTNGTPPVAVNNSEGQS